MRREPSGWSRSIGERWLGFGASIFIGAALLSLAVGLVGAVLPVLAVVTVVASLGWLGWRWWICRTGW